MPPTQPSAEPNASIGAKEVGAMPVANSAPEPAIAAKEVDH